MSDTMIAQVLSLPKSNLSRGAHTLLLLIAHHTNHRTGLAFPGHRLLAQELRVTERHIKRLIHEVWKLGYLQMIPGQGRGHLTVYRLQVSPPEVIHRKGDIPPAAPKKKGDIAAPIPAEKGTLPHPPIDVVEQTPTEQRCVSYPARGEGPRYCPLHQRSHFATG
jgi:hypothetical protein